MQCIIAELRGTQNSAEQVISVQFISAYENMHEIGNKAKTLYNCTGSADFLFSPYLIASVT